jgi:hypothetical protein
MADTLQQLEVIFSNNQTLQRLFLEFNIDFTSVQTNLLNTLLANDALIQANTVYNLGQNPNVNLDISALNQAVSTAMDLFPGPIASPFESNYRNYLAPNSPYDTYVYFLRWIYYTYKYFNEDSFFFNNLLNHYIPTYDAEIISSTTNLKIYFDGLGILLDTLNNYIEQLYTLGNVNTIEDQYLQYMAQLLGYQKEDFTIEDISFRELIKNLITIYQFKGTDYSFDLFFSLLGFSTDLEEFYWDRDAQNPMSFGGAGPTSYLYYLTTQDPRYRTTQQTSLTSVPGPIQPIPAKYWVQPQDLRLFNQLQGTYSVSQILGFQESSLPPAQRFTYFKTNYVQFSLNQYYTQQDLTAKDTDTILKYIKFLTPIYISSLIEVGINPWQDFFIQSNPDAGSITIDSNPGTPPWVDILLPFLFITLRDYPILELAPTPVNAVIIANNGWSDLNQDGYADTALPFIFGVPGYGTSITGTVDISSPINLGDFNNFIGVKLGQGFGTEVSIVGNTSLTYNDLVNSMNSTFTANNINATATIVGIVPNLDIRIYSDSAGPTSKILIIPGITSDLLAALNTTPLTPVDGNSAVSGYQDLGLQIGNVNNLTNLAPTITYTFFINVDIAGYVEIDCSGPVPTSSSSQDIVNAINNNYSIFTSNSFSFDLVSYLAADMTTAGQIAVAYNDESLGQGKVIILDDSGAIASVGDILSLYPTRNLALASTRNININRFLVAWFDLNPSVNYAKWIVYDNTGSKVNSEAQLDSDVNEIVATCLVNNNIVVAYTTLTDGQFQIFDISGTPNQILPATIWSFSGVANISITPLSTGFVITGNQAVGGVAVYFDQNGNPLFPIGSPTVIQSTIPFTSDTLANTSAIETSDGNLFIAYSTVASNPGYAAVLDPLGNILVPSMTVTPDPVNFIEASNISNGNILIGYNKMVDNFGYFKILSPLAATYKNEAVLYNSSTFSNPPPNAPSPPYMESVDGIEMTIILLPNTSVLFNLSTTNGGVVQIWNYLGAIASVTGNFLTLSNPAAVSGWDSNVNSYAATTDAAHLFVIDGQTFVSDDYSAYYESIGVSFVRERNSFNTFYAGNPSDDIIPLIEDTLNMAFTILIGVPEQPAADVDDVGFYITRNGYISRNEAQQVAGNAYNGYYTRHQDYSDPIRTDLYKITDDINWNEWAKGNVTYANWDSWTLAVDYLVSMQSPITYVASGTAILSGTAQYGRFETYSYFPTGNFITYMSNVITFASVDNSVNTSAADFLTAGFSPGLLVQITGSVSNNVLGVIVSVTPTKMILTQCTIVDESDSNNITINVTALSFTGNGEPYGPAQNYVYLPSGTAIFSGAAITSAYTLYSYEASGTAHLSGAAVTRYTWSWVYVASGTAILSGAITGTQVSVNYTASGTAVLSGSAQTQANRYYTGSGTAILSGSALTSRYPEYAYTASGTAILSGSAVTQQYSIIATVQGGTAIFVGVVVYMSPGTYIGYTLTDLTFMSSDNSINTVSGNFLTAGFLAGQYISVSGSVFNNFTNGIITSVTTTKIILSGTTTITNESDTNSITITYASLTFLAIDNSVNLNVPGVSWLALGFAAGQYIVITGSASNDGSGYIRSVTATKMVLNNLIVVNEADPRVVTFTADEVVTLPTVNYSPSGTTHLSGSATTLYMPTYQYIGSGTAYLQGAAAYQAFSLGYNLYYYTGSGTAVFSGSAPVEPDYSNYIYEIAGGTAVFSGAAITSSP